MDVYTRETFAKEYKLFYRSETLKCEHGILINKLAKQILCPGLSRMEFET